MNEAAARSGDLKTKIPSVNETGVSCGIHRCNSCIELLIWGLTDDISALDLHLLPVQLLSSFSHPIGNGVNNEPKLYEVWRSNTSTSCWGLFCSLHPFSKPLIPFLPRIVHFLSNPRCNFRPNGRSFAIADSSREDPQQECCRRVFSSNM